ncbi:hypothetical protein [Flavobacterium muglaense]|uniref:Uncharacterized protein n=1 Tax=Flavobacterium muglaense TaxID=2764716 RepID=A0A923MXF9_9FLAO|nr:hypothetical protein [Flavobacterium muglaense]MBC5836365.1 hypothetical protein [Flavobacterium muglaense]MBC5842895.1 hypothetical protein [Flavobacterium muglaense]
MINTIVTISKRNSVRLFFMFALILVSSVSFGQSKEVNNIVSSTTEVTNEVKQQNSRATSNMEFVLWFMGSKQDPNSTISTEGVNTKKQIMTSGLAPNRLLIKAFLKKAVNFESAVA